MRKKTEGGKAKFGYLQHWRLKVKMYLQGARAQNMSYGESRRAPLRGAALHKEKRGKKKGGNKKGYSEVTEVKRFFEYLKKEASPSAVLRRQYKKRAEQSRADLYQKSGSFSLYKKTNATSASYG